MSGSTRIAARIDWASDWDRDAALTTAKLLLEIKAVDFRPEEPYTLTSGWKSPVYIDCRKIIFFPRDRGNSFRRLDRRTHGRADGVYP